MTQIDFSERPQTKKGELGEAAVDEYLQRLGIVPYRPVTENRAHPFDRLCATADKRKIFIAETKSKAARNLYPDTGINLSNYHDYMRIMNEHGIDVWLFFVDEHRKEIYGNKLSELDKPRTILHKGRSLEYPMNQKDKRGRTIRYFPLNAMKTVAPLNEATAEALKQLSTRNYEYNEGASAQEKKRVT